MDERTTPCKSPEQFEVTLARGSRTISIEVRKRLNSLAATSAVYVISHGCAIQYVGQSSRFGGRFVDGIAKQRDYQWPASGGTFSVAAWTFQGSSQHFREAVELEVALRIRLATGSWPIELGGLRVNSPQRSDGAILHASPRAAEIVGWLIANRFCQHVISEESDLLERFEELEAKRPRP